MLAKDKQKKQLAHFKGVGGCRAVGHHIIRNIMYNNWLKLCTLYLMRLKAKRTYMLQKRMVLIIGYVCHGYVSLYWFIHYVGYSWYATTDSRAKWVNNGASSTTIMLTPIWVSINPLLSGRFEIFLLVYFFKLILTIEHWGISCQNAIRLLLLDLAVDEAALIHVMVW